MFRTSNVILVNSASGTLLASHSALPIFWYVTHDHFSVYLVYKCNFNDDRLIESIDINVDTLKDKELTWYDLYLNKKKDNNVKIAPVYLERNELYFLENNNGKISVVKKNGFAKYYCENYDDELLISTHIYCISKN